VSFSVGQVLDVGTDRITTSAILKEGNVGGPLVDSAGRVIAMNVGTMEGTYVAQNERGQVSDWTLAAAPSVPLNFRIVKQVGRELTVAWDRPVDPGADAISSIGARAYPGSSQCSVSGRRQVRLQTQCTLRSMVIGIPYTLYISAGNQFGSSQHVYLPARFTPVCTAPGAPQVVTAAYDGAARTVKIRWKKPNDGASPLTGYTAGLVPGGQQCSVPPGSPAQLTCTLRDVSLASGMQAQVRAENQIGPGEWGSLPVAWRRVASCAAVTERASTRLTCEVERDRDTGGN